MPSAKKMNASMEAARRMSAGISSRLPVAQIQLFRRLSWRSRLEAVIVMSSSAVRLSRKPNRNPRG